MFFFLSFVNSFCSCIVSFYFHVWLWLNMLWSPNNFSYKFSNLFYILNLFPFSLSLLCFTYSSVALAIWSKNSISSIWKKNYLNIFVVVVLTSFKVNFFRFGITCFDLRSSVARNRRPIFFSHTHIHVIQMNLSHKSILLVLWWAKLMYVFSIKCYRIFAATLK